MKIQRGRERERERERERRVPERETDIAERKRDKSGDRGWRLREIKVEQITERQV